MRDGKLSKLCSCHAPFDLDSVELLSVSQNDLAAIRRYLTPEALLPHLSPSISFTPQSRILLMGCGCSG
jgi:hypothetical protein